MFVTPQDIDERVETAEVLPYRGIHQALYGKKS